MPETDSKPKRKRPGFGSTDSEPSLHSNCQRKLRTLTQPTKPCQIKLLYQTLLAQITPTMQVPQYPQHYPQMALHGTY